MLRLIGGAKLGTVGLWSYEADAVGLRSKRAPLDSCRVPGKPVSEREAFYDRKWRNGASLQACRLLLDPENVL